MVEDYVAARRARPRGATRAATQGNDAFSAYRIDEQIAKALDRKVWLPSGGSLVIDRTEAMTVVDVNTGKFTGSGGNLEETVTKNNLEAAEEIVRQLRLRDIGGIIVVDFIDMVLESNRDLVLRRMVECLGRDRTRHQVAEVTSLGLVQMTRKRIGTGLLEAFSESCEHCQGRGLVIHHEPVEPKKQSDEEPRRSRRGGRGGRGRTEGEEPRRRPRHRRATATATDRLPRTSPRWQASPRARSPRTTSRRDGPGSRAPRRRRRACRGRPARSRARAIPTAAGPPDASRTPQRRRRLKSQAEQTERPRRSRSSSSPEQPVSEQEPAAPEPERSHRPEKPAEPAAPDRGHHHAPAQCPAPRRPARRGGRRGHERDRRRDRG